MSSRCVSPLLAWARFAAAGLLLLPVAARAAGAGARPLKVLMSGGFATAYRQLLPEFERTTGIRVITATGASQGSGPDTIGGQLRRGVATDVIILSRDGLADLITEGRITAGSDTNLAQTSIGAACVPERRSRTCAAVEAFKRALLQAKLVILPGSTTGIYMQKQLLPRLGIADKVRTQVTARGSEATSMVASGAADLTLLPVSEIMQVPGVDLAGTIPAEIQNVLVFAAAAVKGTKQADAAKKLIACLESQKSSAAVRSSGMEPPSGIAH